MKKSITSTHKNTINIVLIVFLIFKIISLTSNFWYTLVEPFDLPKLTDIYNHSQYNLGNQEFYGNMEDDMLYQFSGYRYIMGHDPALTNPETPYLAKYLYGLGILLFKNAVFVQNIFALLLIFAIYKLTFTLTQNSTLSLLSSALITLDKIFVFQSFHTLLDLPHALFITLSFLTFTLFLQNQNSRKADRFIIATSIFIGLVASTKFYLTALILFLTFFIFLPKNLKSIARLTIPSLLIYLSTHIIYFVYHPSIYDFVLLHLSNLKLYKSYLPEYPYGEFLRIIFTGNWRTWWGDSEFVKVEHWSVLWPVFTATSLLAPLLIKKSKRTQILPMYTFVTLYIFTSLFHVVFPRYVLSIFPLLTIISIATIANLQLLNAKLKPDLTH